MINLFKKHQFNFDFMGKRKLAYIASCLLLITSIASFCIQGLNYGIDFEGGILIEATSEETIDVEAVRTKLSFMPGLTIQTAGMEGKTILIQAKPETTDNAATLIKKMKTVLGSSYTYDQEEFVGPTIGNELKQKSILASVMALLAISIYIWFRFEWPFAIGCLASLAHDLIIIVGAFSLLQIEFDMIVVAGLLSLAGYDCNDTIVTYDRIRENLRKFRKMNTLELLNRSVNETFSRTILTSLTTLFVVLILFFIGGATLEGFSIAMILGTIFGTYSSIYIAVPLLNCFDIRSVGETADLAPKNKD